MLIADMARGPCHFDDFKMFKRQNKLKQYKNQDDLFGYFYI